MITKQQVLLTQQIRDAVQSDARSYRELARATGLSVPQISRFARGLRDLRFESLDTLADVLGLRLVTDPVCRKG